MSTLDKRGERNNNPCNLEYGIPWVGLVGHDGKYCVFDTPTNGIRAGARDLHTKIKIDGLTTLEKIIPKFAPPEENDTEAYIQNMVGFTGFTRDEELDPDAHTLAVLLTGIIRQEQGRVIYSAEQILDGVLHALAA